MPMKIIHHFFFLTFLLSPAISFGGGSVTWNEVKSVLDQRPEIARVVYSTLDCFHSGYTPNRIGGMFPLGGKRLGPYGFRCRVKGNETNYDLVLSVNTSYKLLDAEGKDADISIATRVDEKFRSIELKFDKCLEDWCKAP